VFIGFKTHAYNLIVISSLFADVKHLTRVIADLNAKFGLDIGYYRLRNVEVGVNIYPPIPTRQVLNNLLFHRNKQFKDISLVRGGNYKQVVHQRYLVKIYDKHKQYRRTLDLSDNRIMRFELKYVKMLDLHDRGIYTLMDVLESNNQLQLIRLLLDEWKAIHLYDPSIATIKLSPHIRNSKLYQWQNPNYWSGLLRQRKYEQFKLYNKVIQEHSNKLHSQTNKAIQHKCENLINIS
jgi:hypothetical protein